MFLVTKLQRKRLDEVGLLKYRKVGYNYQDQNFAVVNKEHTGRNKHYYVVEEPEIMAFLGQYDDLNLQKIRKDQLVLLQEKGFLNEKNMQYWDTYVPNALAYQDMFGTWRIKKVTGMMQAVGIWRINNAKRMRNLDNENASKNTFAETMSQAPVENYKQED